MRVVLLIDGFSPNGGGERLAMQIAMRLDGSRFERTLCVSRWKPSDLERPGVPEAMEEVRDAGVELLLLDRDSPRDLPAWRPLWQRMRAGKVDVLHAHKFGSNFWAATLARTAGVPVVLTHEHNWSYEGQAIRRALDRHLIARRSDAFMAVSRENLRRMIEVERIDPASLMFIANGIPALNGAAPRGDVRAELGIATGAPVVGIVAVLRREKRVDVLVRAVAELIGTRPDLQVVVAGGGPEQEELEALAAQLGAAHAFHWLGMRTDVPQVIETFNVAVLSSEWEGSPLSVMEYMQAGKPVVATRVGGVPELVDEGRTGLLVDPGDHEAMAAAIDRFLDDPAFAADAGRRGYERQQAEFDLDLMVRRLATVYERLYEQKRAGARTRRSRRQPATALAHPPVELEVLPGVTAAREHWQALAERCPDVFSTWEWADAWWRVNGQGHTPLVTLARRGAGGEPFALLPLYVGLERPARVVRLIGHGPADELGPVCAPEDRADAMAATARALEPAGRWDLFIAERVTASEDWRAALGADLLQRDALPVLRFDGDFEAYLATRSRNFRQQVRRRERNLARDHELRFRLADDPERLDDDMTTLLRLHAARWAGASTTAFDGPREHFHRDFAARALERGWLRLWFLELDGEPAAAWYGFRYSGADSFYQAGRDPAFADESVGFVLMAHTLRDALDSGICTYRLLLGDEDYKSRFANAADSVDTLVRAATLRGRTMINGAQVARGLPDPIKRPLARIARR